MGPTSSGKTNLSLQLASKLGDCWVVNCDSRQVYKGLNIGTGKIEGDWKTITIKDQKVDYYNAGGQKHLLIDYIDTKDIYKGHSLVDFLQDYTLLINQIKPKNIVLVGGTGWYARSIYKSIDINLIKPEYQTCYNDLKSQLRQKKLTDLHLIYGILYAQNTCFANAKILNQSDWCNPVRLQNYILEVVSETKKWKYVLKTPQYDQIIKLAIIPEPKILHDAIKTRLNERINQGLVEEVINLSTQLCSQDFDVLGLEYRLTNKYLLGQITYEKLLDKLLIENLRYAKRQISLLNGLKEQDQIIVVKDQTEGLTRLLENLEK